MKASNQVNTYSTSISINMPILNIIYIIMESN